MESTNLMNDSKSEDEEQELGAEQLEFQDIPHTAAGTGQSTEQSHVLTNFPDPDDTEDEDAVTLLEGRRKKAQASFWTFAYYQSFFNVNTNDVLWRVLFSMIPNPRSSFLRSRIQDNPDLYGPFWTCTTLIFAIAVTGNIASYFSHSDINYKWHYDFRKVTLSATAIYTYWWLMPTLLYTLFWWRQLRAYCTFTELLSIYGYSLFIYIPISVLWMVPINWLQWLLVMLGMILSGSVLLLSVWPIVRQDKPQLYFFHVPTQYTPMQYNITTVSSASSKFMTSSMLSTSASNLTLMRRA